MHINQLSPTTNKIQNNHRINLTNTYWHNKPKFRHTKQAHAAFFLYFCICIAPRNDSRTKDN